MAAMGIPEDKMVLAILNPDTREPISPVTLRKHFREELDKGMVQADTKVAAALFKNATTPTEQSPGGLPIAQIFWLKCRARWQQNPERNPAPPPPAPEATDKDTAKRLAFLLEKRAKETDTNARPRPEPAKKRKITATT